MLEPIVEAYLSSDEALRIVQFFEILQELKEKPIIL
jgi:hypothetical protein